MVTTPNIEVLKSIFQNRSPAELNFSLDTNKAQRELVVKLEAKNRQVCFIILYIHLYCFIYLDT